MTRDLRFIAAVLATAALLGLSCSHATTSTTSAMPVERPRQQENFGVEMARMNLWREAMFRFQRAIAINPGDAMAHNNLAVAYEANGDFEKARREYLEALKLDKGNQYIQKNYSRFVEFTSRNKKRTPQKTASTTTPSAQTSSQPTVGVAPLVPPPPGVPMEGTQPVAPPTPPGQTPPSDQPQPPQQKPPQGGQ
ncbi:MAG TPA: tetratricopeptide repeat protein [Thermoanaerobaculia bacterium]